MFLAGVVMSAAILPASAQNDTGFVTGADLLKTCNDSSLAAQALCTGYLEGVADDQGSNGGPCVPPGIDIAKVKDAVLKYISVNPVTLRYKASRLAAIAFEGNWVCPTTPKPN